MEIITTPEKLKLIPRGGLVKLKCKFCEQPFERPIRTFRKYLKLGGDNGSCCSYSCANSFRADWHESPCSNCGKPLKKRKTLLNQSSRKSDRIFCDYSCASTYNNTHKTHGCRRSKLESYLQLKLTAIYPKLEIHYNQKNTINSELDIYIPSLKFAIELNGAFHYEPIFGKETLSSIQNNDARKFQACLERGIELLIIDSSSQKYFKEQSSKQFLDMITKIVNRKLGNASI